MCESGVIRALFLCTGNSCRSQMAEGWCRHLKAGAVQARSAGTQPHGIDPVAIKVMAEAGVDISGQKSKPLSALKPWEMVRCAINVFVGWPSRAKARG